MGKHFQLVLAADRGDYCLDRWIRERCVKIGRTLGWRGPRSARRRVLDRKKAEFVAEPPKPEFKRSGEGGRRTAGRPRPPRPTRTCASRGDTGAIRPYVSLVAGELIVDMHGRTAIR